MFDLKAKWNKHNYGWWKKFLVKLNQRYLGINCELTCVPITIHFQNPKIWAEFHIWGSNVGYLACSNRTIKWLKKKKRENRKQNFTFSRVFGWKDEKVKNKYKGFFFWLRMKYIFYEGEIIILILTYLSSLSKEGSTNFEPSGNSSYI